MNSLDRKPATTLKAALKKNKDGSTGEKLSNEFKKILERVVSEDLRGALEMVFSEIARQSDAPTQPEVTEALRMVRTLLERGFRETPSVAFLAWLDLFSGLSLDEALSAAPNTICFGRWIKKAKVSAQEIQRQLAERPDQAYASVGADWLLEHAKPEVSSRVVGKLLTRKPRPEYLLPWNEALAAAFKKDKRGELLAVILRQPSPNQDQVQALSEAVRVSFCKKPLHPFSKISLASSDNLLQNRLSATEPVGVREATRTVAFAADADFTPEVNWANHFNREIHQTNECTDEH